MKAPTISVSPLAVLALLAVAGIGLYVAKKGVAGAAAGAVAAAGEAAVGTVTGIGQLVGIPLTNETECEKAKREGRTWDASFACPASNFIGYLFRSDSDMPQARYDETESLTRPY